MDNFNEFDTVETLRSKVLEVRHSYDHLIADLVKAIELRDNLLKELTKSNETAYSKADKMFGLVEAERQRYLDLLRDKFHPQPKVVVEKPLKVKLRGGRRFWAALQILITGEILQ